MKRVTRPSFTMMRACCSCLMVFVMATTTGVLVMAQEPTYSPIGEATDSPVATTDAPTPAPITTTTPAPTPPPSPQSCQLGGDNPNLATCPTATSPTPSLSFCQLPSGSCLAAPPQNGICTPIPSTCSTILNEVCGCDGVTYANECEAHAAGQNVASAGGCVVVTGVPTGGPTKGITMGPSVGPTPEPTLEPTKGETSPPTPSPVTDAPSDSPTRKPTVS